MSSSANEVLRSIIRSNVVDIQRINDSVIEKSKEIKELNSTLQQIVNRLEKLEGSFSTHRSDGIKAFSVNNAHYSEIVNSQQLTLDASIDDLEQLVSQHPSWLRPFSISAELQRREEIDDHIRIIRNSSGYLNVIRLQTGSEWAYFEPMTVQRLARIPLLAEVFKLSRSMPEDRAAAYVVKPIRLGTLQKAVLWEVKDIGAMEFDAK